MDSCEDWADHVGVGVQILRGVSRALVADRVTLHGFSRTQRWLAVVALVTMVVCAALPLVGGGPVASVVDGEGVGEFRPLTLSMFMFAVLWAGWCAAAALDPSRWRWGGTLAGAAAVAACVVLYGGYQMSLGSSGWVAVVAASVAVAVAIGVLLAGVRRGRPVTGWLGFAMLSAFVSAVAVLLALMGAVDTKSFVGQLGAASYGVTFTVGYVAFLGVVVAAPLELLSSFDEKHGELADSGSRWLAGGRAAGALGVAVGVVMALVSVWLYGGEPGDFWVTVVAAAAGTVFIVLASASRPIVSHDLPLAAVLAAIILAAPYLGPLGNASSPAFRRR